MKPQSSGFNKVYPTSSPLSPRPGSTNISATSTASRSVFYVTFLFITLTRLTVSSFTFPSPSILPLNQATIISSTSTFTFTSAMTTRKISASYRRNTSQYKKDEDSCNLNSNLLTRTNMQPGDDESSPSSNSMSPTGTGTGTVTGRGLNSPRKRHIAARTVSNILSSFPHKFGKSSVDTVDGDGDGPDSNIVSQLQQENEILRQSITSLEKENRRLERSHVSQNIIVEQFEGEKKTGNAVESTWWDVDIDANTNSYSNSTASGQKRDMQFNDLESHRDCCDESSKGLSITSASHSSIDSATATNAALEEYDDDDDRCPLEPDISFKAALKDRAYWLVGLLTLQSLSGFILARNELLLQTHPVIVYFLTMLVGAGGNAGNQAAVRVIRGIALGTLNERTQRKFLNREFKMAMTLSVILSCAGFVRATVFGTPFAETVAVTTALAIIVFISICLGAVLPLMLRKINVDPAHSSTTIQVIMDILGVVLTVFVSTTILDTPLGQTIIDKLTFNS